MARTSRSREPAAARRLDEHTVAEAALALVATGGIDGLTMRALGQALGVEAMSLYHWFPSKERLLDAIADCLLARVALPGRPTAASWRRWLVETARSYRRVGLAYPRAFPLLATRRLLSPGANAFLQAIVAAHLAAGFSVREAVRLTRSIGAYVNGMVLLEVSPSPLLQSADGAAPSSGALEARHWDKTLEALGRPELDGAFEYGLACLLDGAERRRKA
jgi:AcrR family transcriptional regulator